MTQRTGSSKRAAFPVVSLMLALTVAGCSAVSDLGSEVSSFNPFAKEDPPLPGERSDIFAEEFTIGSVEEKALSVPSAIERASWSQPGGTIGNNPGNVAFSGARKAWSTSSTTGSLGSIPGISSAGIRTGSRPIVHNGLAILYNAAGSVVAYSAASGGRAWSVNLKPEKESSRAFGGGIAGSGDRIYAVTGYGKVVALDARSGREIWNEDLSTPARGAPTISDGRIFMVSQNNAVFALSTEDGSLLWAYRGIPENAGLLSAASPAVSGKTVVVPFSSGELLALDVEKGTPKWLDAITQANRTLAISGISDISGSPVIDSGRVFATGVGGRTIAVELKNGNRLWEQNIGGIHTPSVTSTAVYLVDLKNRLIALNRKDGEVAWIKQLPKDGETRKRKVSWAGPILAGGRLWLASSFGDLISVDASNGSLGNKRTIGSPVYIAPIAAAGRMVMVSGKGGLIAFR